MLSKMLTDFAWGDSSFFHRYPRKKPLHLVLNTLTFVCVAIAARALADFLGMMMACLLPSMTYTHKEKNNHNTQFEIYTVIFIIYTAAYMLICGLPKASAAYNKRLIRRYYLDLPIFGAQF